MFRHIARLACAIVTALVLGACMLPEKFSAEIDYRPDASYHYLFKGTAVNVAAAVQLKKAGWLTPRAQQDLEEEARKMRNNPEVHKASHLGNGRFDLQSDGDRKPGESTHLFNFLKIVTDENTGVTTIASNAIKDDDLQNLASLHVPLDGTLTVRLPDNAEVLAHNAHWAPVLGWGDYSWSIHALSQRPVITIRFAPLKKDASATDSGAVHNDAARDAAGEGHINDGDGNATPPPQRSPQVPNSTTLLWPVFALVAWTMCMILYLAYRRMYATTHEDVDILQFALGESGELPESVILVHRNYMNLLEMPLLFYVVCVLAFAAGVQSSWLVTLAWGYVVLRVTHSVVHVTYNHIPHRFALFAGSNVVLAGMWLMTGWTLASGA
ncbi:hypothetical protein SDC9_121971 [bioreactor metagenome]|uniref:MAPEG family protein n=1 Tax=bioreactor metagenome TaxID=1076179 RepID=A0A645CDJ2_9ZZZZ